MSSSDKYLCDVCGWIGFEDDMADISLINGSWEWHGFKCPVCGNERVDDDENVIEDEEIYLCSRCKWASHDWCNIRPEITEAQVSCDKFDDTEG